MEIKTPEQVAEHINTSLAEFKSQLAKSADVETVKALETDYKEFRTKHEDFIKDYESKTSDLENRLKESIDRMNKKGQVATPQQKTLRAAILEEFKTDKWAEFLKNRGEGPSPKMDVKSVTWLGTDKVDGVVHNFMPFQIPVYPFYEPVDMRLILPVGISDTASLDFPQRKAITGGVVPAAETAESAATDFTMEMITINSKRKATHTDVSRRALRSTNWLANWIAGQFQEEFVKALNTDIIMGDGTGEHFDGLDNTATAWTAPTGMTNKIAAGESTLIDSVLAMKTGFYLSNNAWPNALFVSPTTAWLLSGAKATTREFVNPNVFTQVTEQDGVTRIGGVAVYASKDVADNNAIMGLISQNVIELLNFEGITIDSTQYHDKNFTSNLITFRLESDMLLPIYRPYCFIKADLTAVQTAITGT